MKHKIFLFFLLFICDNTFSHGFALDTSVQMKDFSTLSIENIAQQITQKKLYVCSFDKNRNRLRSSRIRCCGISRSSSYISLMVTNGCENDEVVCASTQEFYCVRKGGWLRACDLDVGDALRCIDGKSVVVGDIVFHCKSLNVGILEIAKLHTFFVGKFALLAHNMVLPVEFGTSAIPLMAEAGSSFGPVSLVCGVAAGLLIALGIKYFCKKKVCEYEIPTCNVKNIEKKLQRKKKLSVKSSGDTTYFFPKGPNFDPDDKKDEKKKHPHGKYKDVDYHHRQSRGGKGGKSCSPKDGQQALDNSIAVPGNTTRRIGVSCNEIVVLDQTSEGLYHGHVRTWKELVSGGCRKPQLMRNALVDNGLVSSSGKILL